MNPETALLVVSLALVVLATVGRWLLRPGGWFDQRIAEAVDGPLS